MSLQEISTLNHNIPEAQLLQYSIKMYLQIVGIFRLGLQPLVSLLLFIPTNIQFKELHKLGTDSQFKSEPFIFTGIIHVNPI